MSYKKSKLPKCKVCGKLLTRPEYVYCKKHVATDEYKKEMSKSILSLNKKQSVETRRKISDGQKGEKGNNWRGGITKKGEAIRASFEYKEWRRGVFERDNYTCLRCGQRGGRLNAHHKKQVAYHPDKMFDISNGETLCELCHKKVFVKRYNGKIGENVFIHEDSRRILYEFYKGEYGLVEAVKILWINDTIPIGDHFHRKKVEIFFLASGEFLELVLGEKTTYHIPAPYKVVVKKGVYHKFVCSPGSILIGFATAPFDPNDEIKINT